MSTRREEPDTTAAFVYYQQQIEEDIPIGCVGHIRPHATYDTDLGYGFDWMRIGDTTYGGKSIVYKGIVGKQHKRGTKTPIDDDVNKNDGDFEAQDTLYERLENEYNMASGAKVFTKKPGGVRERYYVPILALPRMGDIKELERPPVVKQFEPEKNTLRAIGKAAMYGALARMNEEKYFVKLELRLTITKPPKKLYWQLPERYEKEGTGFVKGKPIEIKCPDLPVAVCDNKKIEFEIGCSTIIPETIDVKLMALGHNGKSRMVGVFRIWRNTAKKKKIVLVQVVSNLGKGEKKFDDSELVEETKFIKKYLLPALVIPDIEIIKDFRMNDTGWFSKKHLNEYKTNSGKLLVLNDYKKEHNLYAHLHTYFTEKQKGYDNAIILYFVNEETQKLLKINGKGVYDNFYAAHLQGSNLIIVSAVENEKDYAASHEIIHALGILHSFTNSEAAKGENVAKHTFQAKKTDNLMDYAKYQFSLWYWQWQQMHKK